MNLAHNLTTTAERYPDRVAVRLDHATMTYAELDHATRRVAGLLAERGLGPGDRVGIMLPNVPQWAVLYFGVLRAGAIAVPMNPLLKEREVTYYLADSGARLIFAWHTLDEVSAGAESTDTELQVVEPDDFEALLSRATPLDDVVAQDPGETAVLLYTSGTTGQPKGAELTHENILRNVEIVIGDVLALTSDDVIFGGLPLFHVFGQTAGLNAAVAVGASLTLLPRFEPTKALEVMARDGVTVLEAVPTMYIALLNHPDRPAYEVANLRACVTGGAAMPVEVMRGFEDTFGCVVLEGYGLSETSPLASCNLPGKRRPGSIGTPVNGVRFRLIDDAGTDVPPGEVGEIAISGHNVMKGYWNNPEATAAAVQDGWFRTGDLAQQDEDGFYFIVDRKKDLIIRGGYNVYPREIEEVFYEHPAVAEAAVIGFPHDTLGEEIAAVVALKPGAAVAATELRDFVKNKVAAYKYPRRVDLVASLPKGPTGKILKREIQLGATA